MLFRFAWFGLGERIIDIWDTDGQFKGQTKESIYTNANNIYVMALWASMKRSLKVKFYILFLQISYIITYTYYRGEKRKKNRVDFFYKNNHVNHVNTISNNKIMGISANINQIYMYTISTHVKSRVCMNIYLVI